MFTPQPPVARSTAYSDAYARSRAISGAKLATLIMATGDPHEACTIGHRAIDDAGQLRSRRAADDLRESRRFASKLMTPNPSGSVRTRSSGCRARSSPGSHGRASKPQPAAKSPFHAG